MPVNPLQRGQRVRLRRTLVGTIALDPGETEGQPSGILRARLHLVERDLDHQLRPHVDGVVVPRDLQLEQLGGLPGEHLVGHPLEGLAQHHEAAGLIAGAEMEVAEPTLPPPVAPLGREHHQVQPAGGLELEPPAAAAAGLVGRVEGLGHQSLVPALKGGGEKVAGLLDRRGDQTGNQQRLRHRLAEQGEPPPERLVYQRGTVQVQEVEEKRREGQRLAQPVHLELAAEAAHGGLERVRRPVGPEREDLAFQDQLPRRQRAGGLDQLGHRAGDVVEPAGVDPHLVAAPVDLDPGAVQLELERRLAQLRERVLLVVRRAGEHREHRPEELDRKPGEAGKPVHQRGPGYAGQIARHHDGAAHGLRWQRRGSRHRLQHHRLERTLAQLAGDEAKEEPLLLPGQPRQQLAQEPLLLLGRSLAGHPGDPVEHRVHLGDLDRGRLRDIG